METRKEDPEIVAVKTTRIFKRKTKVMKKVYFWSKTTEIQ